jgi:hypothetical protein
MEQYRPVEAVKAFEEVVALAPDWSIGRLDLGIALLNSQTDEGYVRAEEVLTDLLEDEPDNQRAHYSLGMLLRHLTRFDEARGHFRRVLEIDPEDPDAHYQLGILVQDESPQEARRHLEKTLARIPHHESTCYRLQTILRQAGEKDAAAELLARFQSLKQAGAGVFSGMKYGEMGRYADIVRSPRLADGGGPGPGEILAPLYSEVTGSAGLTGENAPAVAGDAPALGPGVAVHDVDGDGDLDLYLGAPIDDGSGELWLQGENLVFGRSEESGIDGRGAVGAWFGDHDKDGDPDLFLSRSGADRLYRNDGGRFVDISREAGIGGDEAVSAGACWLDADHDGDLDLFVATFSPAPGDPRGAPDHLYRNNGDGTFTDVAAEAGIDGGASRSLAVVALDADADRDLDLYVVVDGAPNRLWLNDRVGSYHDGTTRDGFSILADAGPGTGALLGDVDGDGREDLLLLRGSEPPRLFLHPSRTLFLEDERFATHARALGGVTSAMLGDLNLDGSLDLVMLDVGGSRPGRHVLLLNDGRGRFGQPLPLGSSAATSPARGALAADLDADGLLELVVSRGGSSPQLFRAAPIPGRHWLTVMPVREGEEGGSEPAATGLEIELKTGQEVQIRRIGTSSGYMSGSSPRPHFGLGERVKADYVRLLWADSVLQSELEVPADQIWSVAKVVRKPSSCPLLFVWNGERFEFVTDFLGVGGLGFFLEPGVYAPPDPTENVRIPPGMVATRDGRYLLRIAEPLEEVTYLDQLELLVYDHPSGQEIWPDERFAAQEPLPTGLPLAVETRIHPVAARDDRGQDVLDRVVDTDRHFVDPPIDQRFTGFAEDHWVELDFGDRLRDLPAGRPLILYLYGWVEYTYSHVNFAAYQAGLALRAPSIELPDGEGGWRTVVPDMGFPAGLPRMMTVDVTALDLPSNRRVRIRSNMEIFWDEIFLAPEAGGEEATVHRIPAEVAEIRFLGYPREYSPDGGIPTLYDYHRVDPGLPYKIMAGDYTRFGDVRELLSRVDDRFVILGRGEEIALEFDASDLPPLPGGWSRTLVLHSDGYCKDMDLYTAFPDTVGPLPYHAMGGYPPAKPSPAPPVPENRRRLRTE